MPTITNQEDGFSVRTKLNTILGLHTNLQSGDYTLLAADHARMVAIDSATDVELTVPAGLPSDFVCSIAQLGEGVVTVVGSGATVNAFEDIRELPGQYAVAQLYCIGVNSYLLAMMGGGFEEEEAPPLDALTYTSAGVFDSNDVLVRTLWSGVLDHEDAADPAAAWDGTIDDGSVAPTGVYTVRRIQHKMLYSWDGSVGNSSPIHTTATYHAYGSVIRDMAITDAGEIYFSTVYDERIQTFRVSTTSDPQNSVSAVPPQLFRQAIIAAHTVCTDGTIAYLGITAAANESGVIGTDCTTKIKVPFSSGTVVGPLTYLGLNTDPLFAGRITGLAVQQTGDYIFLARPSLPGIQVYNKSTAAFVSTFVGLEHPYRLASNPVTITELWVANDSDGDGLAEEVVKCAIDGAGTITATATTISCQDVLALAVSPDGSVLLVADGGTSQLVRAYNTSDGSVRSGWGTSGTLGTAGGYVNSPLVTNTKFMFYAVADMGSGGAQASLAYQADGKWWLADVGNCRYMRFSSGDSPAFIDEFSYIPGFYPCRVCRNDPTRVFALYREYEIDYSLPLSPTNGSWTLKNNWAGNLIGHASATLLNVHYNALKFIGTYSNGRTYGCVDLPTIALRRVFELTSTGLRSTDWNVHPNGYLDGNMDLLFTSNASAGGACIVTKNAFTGFDGSNNPSWSVNDGVPSNTTALASGVTVFTSATLPALFPGTKNWDNNLDYPMFEATANGTLPFYDPDTAAGATTNHFGGIDVTTGAVKFNTHTPAPSRTGGHGKWALFYPPAPYIGYNIGFGGGPLLYVPGHEHVFTTFMGEEWGNNQTNILTHWHESGLALRQFGVVAPYFGAYSLRNPDILEGDNIPSDSPYSFLGLEGMTGNSRWGGIGYANGNYYLYQNDEWYHGGITRWTVSNLESVFIVDFTVPWDSSSYTPVTDPTDMLEGLTPNAVLVDGDSGWHRSHAEVADQLHAWTNVISADIRKPDISLLAQFFGDAVLRNISRDLTRSGSGDWTLEGDIYMFPGYDTSPFNGAGLIYFDILDDTGKVIIRWYSYTESDGIGPGTIRVNGAALFSIPAGWTTATHTRAYVGAVRPFSIVADVGAGTMTFTYDVHTASALTVFEVGADITSPTTLRLASDGDLPGQPGTCITRLRFV